MESKFKKLVEETASVAQRFVAAGEEIYLVGGSVRDVLMGANVSTDLDFCTSAKPAQIKKLIKNVVENLWAVGEKFGTIGCTYRGRTYEITTFRKEVYLSTSRKPKVKFGDNVADDLKRRDFTVNAMALKLPDAELVDLYEGQKDLEHKILRTPIEAEVLFSEDPLRMLRAARFEAQLEFSAIEDVVYAMIKMADRLDIVSKERQLDEFRRLLCLPNPIAGLKRLAETGLLEKVSSSFPPSVKSRPTKLLSDESAESKYVKSIGSQATIEDEEFIFSKLTELPSDFQTRLSALYIMSKNAMLRIERAGNASGSGSETHSNSNAFSDSTSLLKPSNLLVPSDSPKGKPFNDLPLSKVDSNAIKHIISLVEAAQKITSPATDQQVREIADLAGSDEVWRKLLSLLNIFAKEVGASLSSSLSTLGFNPFTVELPLTSREIMSELDIPPGPKVGEAQKILKELYLAEGEITKQQAVAELKKRLG